MERQTELPGLSIGHLTDSQFMSAEQKRRVLRQWEKFLEHGCRWEHFTKPLYEHLIQNCSFIAHYNREGFYYTYFKHGDDMIKFLSQFDEKNGNPPRSVEYGMTYWVKGEYEDINREMIRIAGKYIPILTKGALEAQRKSDLAVAAMLLEKHGIDTVELLLNAKKERDR